MEVISNNESGLEIQLGLLDSIIDLLMINPIFILGTIPVSISLAVIFRKNNKISKIKTIIFSFLMYYYLCLIFTNIVGLPNISEYMRLSRLERAFFNPKINLNLLNDGISLSFVLNVFLFIPLGFLCPTISSAYERAKVIFIMGLSLSIFIEISQLFTLHRVTDINDVITNITGTMIGYFLFKLFAKLQHVKMLQPLQVNEKVHSSKLPINIIVVALVLSLFN
ncbi:VanZ family protein [Enterococcus casseliflavus]|uniref:VanZ family protein n=1 Tax=Enterococcus casseliflavus TaxID=37734 RepID=UPI002542BCC2|nr:VanZ family protein [Enterococcus casseliflavus]MDK4450926.1 VanZ family protein [Enterococcus casseliflavus]